MAITLGAATSNVINYGSGTAVDALSTEVSALLLVFPTTFTAGRHFWAIANDAGTFYTRLIINDTSGNPRLRCDDIGTTRSDYTANTNPLVLNAWQFVGFTLRTSGTSRAHIYRSLFSNPLAECGYATATDGDGTALAAHGTRSLLIGNGSATGASLVGAFQGRIAFAATWNRVLSRAELQKIQSMFKLGNAGPPPSIPGCILWTLPGFQGTAHPQIDYSGWGSHGTVTGAVKGEDNYQLVKEPAYGVRRRLWIPVSAGGTTVVPGALALITAGLAPVLNLALSPTPVAIALSRFAPVLAEAVIPSAVSLSVSAFAPQIALAIIPPTAALSLSTFAPSIVVGLTVTPGTLSLASTGFAPVLAEALIPSTVSLVTTGFAPSTLAAYSFSTPITISHVKVPATLTDFPLLFSSTLPELKTVGNGGQVQSGSGFDIAFYADAALTTQLDHEVRKWVSTTGQLIAFIRIPSLSHTIDTVIYLAWGDSGISSSQENVGGTWEANFKGVYHLDDGTTLSVADSSGNANNGTNNGATAIAGYLNGGANFVPGSSQNISLGNPAGLQITGNLTIRAIVKPDTVTTINQMIVTKDKDTGGRAYTFDIDDDKVRLYINGGGGSNIVTSPNLLTTTNFWFIAGTYNTSGVLKVYVKKLDGDYAESTILAATQSGADTAIPSATANVRIGSREYSGFEGYYDGTIDQVAIASVERTEQWLRTEFNNLNSPSTFYRIGEVPVLDSKFAFTRYAGVKFRGSNIVPRTTDLGNGDFGVPANFYELLYDWGTGGPTDPAWTQWIKPQIDAVQSLGGNCIRFMFDATVRYGDSTHHSSHFADGDWLGTISQVQLEDMLDQLITYLASLGMYLYATATEIRPVNDSGMSLADLQLYITEYVAKVSDPVYNNVIAIDVLQEWDENLSSGTLTRDNMPACMTTAREALQTPIPLTCSIYAIEEVAAEVDPAIRTNGAYDELVAAGADYFDVHFYFWGFTHANDLINVLANQWGLAVVIGEMGLPYHGEFSSGSAQEATHPFSSEKRAVYYDWISAAGQRSDIQLTANWSIVPNFTSADGNDYGMFAETQDGSFVFTSPRTEMTSRWDNLPVTILDRNAPHIPDLSGADTSAADYSGSNKYAIKSGMLDTPGGVFEIVSNAIKGTGTVSEGSGFLFQDVLPASLGQVVVFEIPAGRTYTRVGTVVNFGATVRHQSNNDHYKIELSSDTSTIIDNKVEIFKYISGVKTSLGSQDYAATLDLTKRWRVTIVVSEAVSPTNITVTVRNVTDAVDMSPALSVDDSTAALQITGGASLRAYLGTPFYDNVSFTQEYDAGPVMATAPTADPSGSTVDLDWAAADGGSGTVDYIPQFVALDADGFPSDEWTNGASTTSTSATITSGLSGGTTYAFRVLAIGSDGTWGYSPWGQAALEGSPSPSTASLSISTFAPTLTFGIVPANATLVIATFAPTVNATASQVFIPSTAGTVLTGFAPIVNAGGNVTVQPATGTFTTLTFAPTLGLTDNAIVIPGTLAVVTIGFAPIVNAGGSFTVSPSTLNLLLTGFSPTIGGFTSVGSSERTFTVMEDSRVMTVEDSRITIAAADARITEA